MSKRLRTFIEEGHGPQVPRLNFAEEMLTKRGGKWLLFCPGDQELAEGLQQAIEKEKAQKTDEADEMFGSRHPRPNGVHQKRGSQRVFFPNRASFHQISSRSVVLHQTLWVSAIMFARAEHQRTKRKMTVIATRAVQGVKKM